MYKQYTIKKRQLKAGYSRYLRFNLIKTRNFRERTEMKTTKSNVKRTLLVGTLILSLSVMTGCVSTHKQQEIENNKKIIELQPNELSLEETRALKPGDIVPKGKEVNRELLEQQGMDYIYIYDVYTRFDDGEIIKHSNHEATAYKVFPSEKKSDYALEHNGELEYLTYVFTMKHYKIVSVDFVKTEDGKYIKKITHKNGRIEFNDVIDEDNIDKD
jgi:hypothetical protein